MLLPLAVQLEGIQQANPQQASLLKLSAGPSEGLGMRTVGDS